MKKDVITRTWAYGCPASADGGAELMSQLRLGNQMWNALVAAVLAHEDVKESIWRRDAATSAAMDALEAAQAAKALAAEQVKRARQEDQSTIPRLAEARTLAEAKKAVAAAKRAKKTAQDAAYPAFEDLFAQAKRDRDEQVHAVSVRYGEEGLGWGTRNDLLLRRLGPALKLVAKRRQAGLPAALRFHRFDGTGTITIQIQWQSGRPPATPDLLAAETPYPEAVLRGSGRLREIRLRVTAGHYVTLPVIVHRDLPPEAVVKEVRVTRLRVADAYRLRVNVVFRLPAPQVKRGGLAVDIDFGWKSAGRAAGLEVAWISNATGLLPGPPAGIADLFTVDNGYKLWVPGAWRDIAARDDAIRGTRDVLIDGDRDDPRIPGIRRVLLDALDADPGLAALLADRPGVTRADILRWRSARRFAWLARNWPRDGDEAAWLDEFSRRKGEWKAAHPMVSRSRGWARQMRAEVLAATPARPAPVSAAWLALEEWRRRDLHLWQYEAHERAQIIARRRDTYRKAAAWICEHADQIILADVDVAELKRKPGLGEEDTYLARGSRRSVQFAAPAEFRAAIESAAALRGIEVSHRKSEAGERAA